MESSPEHTRRRLHDDNTLSTDEIFLPRRMSEDSSFDIDSSDHSHVFDDDIMSSDDDGKKGKGGTKHGLRWLILASCVLFILAVANIYYVISENENIELYENDLGEKDFLSYIGDAIEEVITESEDFMDDDITNEVFDKIDDAIMEGDMVVSESIIEVVRADGDSDQIVIPDDVIGLLNPHSREHWLIIEAALNFGDYDYYDSLTEDKILLDEDVEENGGEFMDLPGGLKYEPPPEETRHVHSEDCDPVAADVIEEDEIIENVTIEDPGVKIEAPKFDNL